MRLTGIDLKAMLAHSYEIYLQTEEQHHHIEGNRLEFLSSYIFGFTTYDSEMDKLFAVKALDVCQAITENTTFDYIKDRSRYEWYLSMCHMSFFEPRICWGTSIRAAFWWAGQSGFVEYDTCGLWIGDDQISQVIQFTVDEWSAFMRELINFASIEDKA
jgi:hypothetical protein